MRRGWVREGGGRGSTAQIQDGAMCAGSPMSWGTALGASNWLDRRQQLLKKLLHSCHLLGGRRDCERCLAGGRRERGRGRKWTLTTDLRTGAMHDTWVSLELDPGWCDNRPELLCRKRPKPYRNHGVQLPMALKDGQVLGTAIGCLWARQDSEGTIPKPPGDSEQDRDCGELTWGNARCRGSQQLNATMPARGWGQVRAV